MIVSSDSGDHEAILAIDTCFQEAAAFGVIGVMLGIGLLGICEGFCTADQSNTLVLAATVALLPKLVIVESQLGQYIAGILQEILLTFLVFLPVTWRKVRLAVS